MQQQHIAKVAEAIQEAGFFNSPAFASPEEQATELLKLVKARTPRDVKRVIESIWSQSLKRTVRKSVQCSSGRP